MCITIKSLWERHKNKSMIARLTGNDWKTVAKRIKEIEEKKNILSRNPTIRSLLRADHEMVRRRPVRGKDTPKDAKKG